MKQLKRLLCLALVLSMVLSTGVLEALALSQDTKQPEVETTGELVDLSEMFVVEETEPQPEQTQKAINEPQMLEPVTFVQTKAAVTGEVEGFAYTVLENGNCSVTGYTGGVTEDLVIPDTLDGYTVSAIGNNAFKGSAFVSIHLPDSVTTIGNGAFQNCAALKSINYPLNLKSVGSGVWSGIFSGCTALESIVVPESVTALPDSVFFYAESLESVTLPSTLVTVGQHAFGHSGITAIDLPDGVTSIGSYAFNECVALETAEVGSSLTSIGSFAFAECALLTVMDLPHTVESLGNSVFKNCIGLESFTYPKNLKNVTAGYQSGILSGCASLETIEIPEGVTALPDDVFFYAESLKSVKLPSTLVTIGKNAFDHSGITAIDLPDGVTSIGNYAFNECVALETAELGSKLTSIGSFAFAECVLLTVMDLPHTVESLGNSVFKNCTGLESFTYPKNLKNVTAGYQSGILSGCTALESVVIPEGVTALPDNMFYYATALKSVTIPSTLISVGGSAFYNCTELTEILLPDTVESIGADAFAYCKKLESFHYPANLKSASGNIWSGIFTGCTALDTIEIPEGATQIPDYTFYYADSVKTVIVPSTVKSVGNYAFYNSGITAIELPDGVMSIGNYAFQNCKELKTADLGSGMNTIGMHAFRDCYALESVRLGDALKSIGLSAFSGCESLTEILLPDTVEVIDNGAFYNCTNLASVNYPRSLKKVGMGYESGIFTGCTSLESIDVPEGVTALPDNMFYYAKSLKSVSLPSTLEKVGSNAFAGTTFTYMNLPDGVTELGVSAFQNCKELIAVELGDSLTTIGGNAFTGCAALAAVNIPETVTSIGNGAFEGCEALASVDIPESVKTLGGGVFVGCTSLKTVDLSSGLQSMGSGMFRNCTALESVVLCDNLSYVQSNTFYGCSSLRSVHLPRNLKQIQTYAFANCANLKELYIPNSVNFIATNAFEGVPEMTFRCDLLSYATEYALDHQFAIIPTKIDDTEIVSPLNTDNSYYIHNYDGLSAAGVMSMAVHYELREDAGVKPKEVTVHVYDFAALREDTLTLDGKQCKNYTYDEETGRLTIPVEAASGTIRFCLKPKRYEALTSYARLVYEDSNGKETLAIIGSVNSLMPALNISAPEETPRNTVHVNGLAVPETDVSLYLDGVLVKTVKSNKVGDYAADISLGEPIEGKDYVITAEAADRNGNLQKAQTNVRYSYKALELLDFVMIYDAHMTRRIDLLEVGDLRPVVVFNPHMPFRFEMKFINPDALSDVFVVSTRNHVKQYLKAYWSEELGVFVAEGYFDPEDHSYVPGVLSLEYVCGGERVSFEQEVDFSSPEVIEALPQVWKDADIEIVKDEEGELVLDITGGYDEEQISFDLSITTQEIPDYLTPETAEDYGYTRIVDDFGKELFIRPRGDSGSGGGGSGSGHGHSAPQFSVLDFAADEVTDYIIDEVQDAFGDALLKEGLGPVGDAFDIIFTIQDGIGTGKDIEELRDICAKNPDLTAEQKQLFNEKAAEAHFINVFGSIIQCALAGASIYAAIAFPPALPILAVGSVAVGGIFDLSMKLRMWDLTASAYGLNIKFRWSIDPSGYVYDEVTGIRLEGVTVHAYWVEYTEEDTDFWDDKPGDDEYGVLWDSLEFSQLNPLVTDTEGRYAWDVPEGWWRVSYEKEGYESIWSEWLPVPPPQTEVNVGLKPLVAAHTHTIVTIPGKAATCTETGLTEGKKCSQCGEVTVEQKEIPVTAHTEVAIPGKAATCTKDGLSEGKKCAKCGEVLIKQVVIVALGHSMVSHGAKAPTCTKKGHKAYESCSCCDYTTYQEVAATGHGYDNILDGTCNSCGVNRADVENRKVVHMFRMYNPNTGEHFYTGSTVERDNLIGHGWQYEGVGFTFPANTGAPVHRLFQPSTGEHLYTMDEAEKDKLMAEGWNYEGIAFNSAYDTEAVQHRLHNPNATVGAYHFTFSTEERNTLISLGWEYQGIGWYSCWK